VQFRDSPEQWDVSLPSHYDKTRDAGVTDDYNLDDFFARPIQVATYTWTPLQVLPFGQNFNPWTLFFGNKRVINRITNFNLLSAQLKVKFMINGNPFLFGRLMADYVPFYADDTVTSASTLDINHAVAASQRLNIMIDPTTSQGGVLSLPFMYWKNNLSIPDAEWASMGQIFIRELVGLKHANGGTDPISITISVWAEQVRLSCPTSKNSSAIVAQSARSEYSSSPIQNMASSVAHGAGMLSNMPVIGPYALATQMISSTVGAIARIFGFSAPANISDLTTMRSHAVTRLANTDRKDDVSKLTLDSKQELTIDPSVCGVQTGDELVISTIATKQSYLMSFDWTTARANNYVLFSARVSPIHVVVDTTKLYIPAVSFAAIPFKYWRGTMKYRFQIVCSAYHRGRIVVSYDPYYPTSRELNVAFSRIVDISNERDFTIEVGMASPLSYLDVSPTLALYAKTGDDYANTTEAFNGSLTVSVLNELTVPNDIVNNDISVNVFVSGCDDLEFAVPTSQHISNMVLHGALEPQSDREEVSEVIPPAENDPLTSAPIEQANSCLDTDSTNLVYFGETITSFRALLKRYNYHSSQLAFGNAIGNIWKVTAPDFPDPRGYYTWGANSDGVNNVNYNPTTLLNYLAPAYLCRRGGLRSKYMFTGDITSTTPCIMVRENLAPGDNHSNAELGINITDKDLFALGRESSWPMSWPGAEVTDLNIQSTIEVELPHYNNLRFQLTKDVDMPSHSRAFNVNWHSFYTTITSGSTHSVDRYVSVAEDFNLVLFQGCPVMAKLDF
jgi:hypothetical protein